MSILWDTSPLPITGTNVDIVNPRTGDPKSEGLITAREGTTLDEAEKILGEHRIEKLPVVDGTGVLRGLITIKDIHKRRQYPDANKDRFGRFLDGGRALRFERLFPGPIERVWDWLTKPELVELWFTEQRIEPRVGGKVEGRFGKGDVWTATVTDWSPPHRLGWRLSLDRGNGHRRASPSPR